MNKNFEKDNPREPDIYGPDRYTIIMAGGWGTRMGIGLPKPLMSIGNKPMIIHLMDSAKVSGSQIILIVPGEIKGMYIQILTDSDYIQYIKEDVYVRNGTIIHICTQPISNGTGGALIATSKLLKTFNHNDSVLVLSGDVPLITKHTIIQIFDKIEDNGTECVILAKYTDNNLGYGRIVSHVSLDGVVMFDKIVEHKDCNEDELLIPLINTGVYGFKVGPLLRSLAMLTNDNSQKEFYLTDCPEIIKNHRTAEHVKLHIVDNINAFCFDETLGANLPEQLEILRKEYLKKFSIEKITDSVISMRDENIHKLILILDQVSSQKMLVCHDNINKIRRHFLNADNSILNRKTTFIVRIEDTIVGTGSVLIEDKIIHNMGRVSHIEDVVIDKEYRNIGLAKILMKRLIDFSRDSKCYKIILDASDNVKGFYEKLGFTHHANSMRLDMVFL